MEVGAHPGPSFMLIHVADVTSSSQSFENRHLEIHLQESLFDKSLTLPDLLIAS